MFCYSVQTKDGRMHCGQRETHDDINEALVYFELTYDNPDVISVNVYERE